MYKRFLLSFSLCLFFVFNAQTVNAKGVIHLLNRKLSGVTTTVSLNGGSGFNLYSEIRQGTGMQKTLTKSDPVMKDIIVNGEGKVLIKANFTFISPVVEKHYVAELNLNIQDGDEVYVSVKYAGIDDLKLVEISEKEAKKIMKDKRAKVLDDITIDLAD